MDPFLDFVSFFCLLVGSIFAVVGGIGLNRFPDFFTRMHGAGITDTMGAGLILIGLMLQSGLSLVTVKLLMILFFLFVTSATSAHALAKSALTHGLKPELADGEEETSKN